MSQSYDAAMPKPIIVALVFAVIVTILVLMNTPKRGEEKRSNAAHVFKTFVVSFIVCGVVAYVMQDNEDNNMMANIIKGEPDF